MRPKARILVVEDESGTADTLQYVLASEGFAPVWCASAEDAIAQFAAGPPFALAILDVGLPDLSGFELFKRLQAIARDAGGTQVPMLFLTARSDEIDRTVDAYVKTLRAKLKVAVRSMRASSRRRSTSCTRARSS